MNKETPDCIPSFIEMNVPNEKLSLYTGEFILKSGEEVYEIDGSVYYKWLPNQQACFEGTILNADLKTFFRLNELNTFSLFINKVQVGEVDLSKIEAKSSLIINGEFTSWAYFGEKKRDYDKVSFQISNLLPFNGQSIKNDTECFLGRITLTNQQFEVTIDKKNYKETFETLKKEGGHILTHSGQIVFHQKNTNENVFQNAINAIRVFLSFCNGRRIGLNHYCFTGEYSPEKTFIGMFSGDMYKSVLNIFPHLNYGNQLETFWPLFYQKWIESEHFLNSIIHWYLEANYHSAMTEGAITLSQIGLESMANHVLNQDKLSKKQIKGLSAADKVRYVLSKYSINTLIPEELSSLRNYFNNLEENDIKDSIDLIINFRNCIVHENPRKLASFINISNDTKFECLQLSLWFLEITILKYLGYQGPYTNRLKSGGFEKEMIENT
ncbi:hypothetical protein [Arcticibacterium luteifluviistationis]|uniref:YopA central domain-containing protein n=1 Tax=Arcticibacterium luteifluviistationis TaxID=1784714 RepID=A0A2Z4GF97_9BACT|nr:hypothetical protein [Arcticibacterium luteifluviistationis]AWV99463.1 hypothetical protein DJ013_15355 [Arcticibacterium luteifluviistationis]